MRPQSFFSVIRPLTRTATALVLIAMFTATTGAGVGSAAPAQLSAGERLWASTYDGPRNASDYATALAVSPDGSKAFVTGYSDRGASTGASDYATVGYDAVSGAKLWVARYGTPGYDFPQAIGVSPDGSRVFVTGNEGGYAYRMATIAYDASTGTRLWISRSVDGYSANALGVSPDGSTVFVTGGSSDFVTIAYDAGTGVELWVSRYNGPANDTDYATELAVSGSIVVVAGTSYGGTDSSFDYATAAYDADSGAALWSSRYEGPGNGLDFASAVGLSPDASKVFVTGSSQVGPGQYDPNDYATAAYDGATGAELWVSRYNGTLDYNDGATDLGVSPDGAMVFVTGYSNTSTPFDYVTLAYDPVTGAALWTSTTGGAASDTPSALRVSPDGSTVFVTGRGQRPNNGIDDFLTAAHDSGSGAELWLARDGRGGYDFASALGVSPDGSKVFVTGSMQATVDSEFDYLTIAYST